MTEKNFETVCDSSSFILVSVVWKCESSQFLWLSGLYLKLINVVSSLSMLPQAYQCCVELVNVPMSLWISSQDYQYYFELVNVTTSLLMSSRIYQCHPRLINTTSSLSLSPQAYQYHEVIADILLSREHYFKGMNEFGTFYYFIELSEDQKISQMIWFYYRFSSLWSLLNLLQFLHSYFAIIVESIR